MKTLLIATTVSVIALELASPLDALGSQKGRVVGWGSNAGGQATGVPSSGYASGFVEIGSQPLSNAMAIAAGRSHALLLATDGTVSGWGFNAFGQATGSPGQGAAQVGNGPVQLGSKPLTGATAVSAGDNVSLALLSNGTVVAWGSNLRHALDVPPGLSNVVAISAGWTHCLAAKRDGTVVGWGSPSPPVGLTNVTAVMAGRAWYASNLALKSDGTVVEWGPDGLATATPAGLTNVAAVAAGANFSLALKNDGTVFGWGGNGSGQATGTPTTVSPYSASGTVAVDGHTLTNIVAIAAGGEYGLALSRDGRVIAWGQIQDKQPTVPNWLSGIVAIAAGDHFCLALTTNSSVWPHNR
jgi:alpha-tubulin suppressor-like RCC1 family protein